MLRTTTAMFDMATGNPRNLHGAKTGWIFFIRGFSSQWLNAIKKHCNVDSFNQFRMFRMRATRKFYLVLQKVRIQNGADGTMILTPASYSNVYKLDIDPYIYKYIYNISFSPLFILYCFAWNQPPYHGAWRQPSPRLGVGQWCPSAEAVRSQRHRLLVPHRRINTWRNTCVTCFIIKSL